ncbi:MAG: hypothetical protein QG552_3062, partial [Thermodesulfobacteriota bacterium]|nr:hypothetical protein [Thermodesulfobacteriota bacterium]
MKTTVRFWERLMVCTALTLLVAGVLG